MQNASEAVVAFGRNILSRESWFDVISSIFALTEIICFWIFFKNSNRVIKHLDKSKKTRSRASSTPETVVRWPIFLSNFLEMISFLIAFRLRYWQLNLMRKKVFLEEIRASNSFSFFHCPENYALLRKCYHVYSLFASILFQYSLKL